MAVIIGNNNGNTLAGTNEDDEIQGLGGNDTLRGRDGNDDLYGGEGRDRLEGGDGDDLLDGGAGADRLIGGDGDDAYYVDNAGDVLVEVSNPDSEDRVYSLLTWTLADRFEHLILQGTADLNGTGNSLGNVIQGNSGNNVLSGLAGHDGLYGEGGNDRLIGGGGDDYLHGGAGVDHMTGGNGGDSYIVDNIADVVNESGTGGSDSIGTSIDYSIENNLNIENLSGHGQVGLQLTGNSLANGLSGTDLGDDVLRGLGGNDNFYWNDEEGHDTAYGDEGNDTFYLEYSSATMYGGTGNDTWELWYGGGPIIEFANEGVDTVITMSDYTLGANLENLVIDPTDLDLDFFVNTGTGNGLNNRIEVIAHYATLNGLGGDDVLISDRARTADLTGGDGADQLYVDALFGVTTLHDFTHNVDTIVLHGDTALAIADGDLAARRFHAGTAAQTSAHRIIYDQSTGNLYYDADGTGAGAQRLIAVFDGTSNAPDHTDFTVV